MVEVRTLTKKEIHKLPPEQREEKLKKARKEHDKLCKGMFEFIDAQGGFLEFNIRLWPGEPITYYKFIHNEICEIPMGIVRHLNNTKKKIRRFRTDLAENGPVRGVPSSYETVSRVRFTPMDVL